MLIYHFFFKDKNSCAFEIQQCKRVHLFKTLKTKYVSHWVITYYDKTCDIPTLFLNNVSTARCTERCSIRYVSPLNTVTTKYLTAKILCIIK